MRPKKQRVLITCKVRSRWSLKEPLAPHPGLYSPDLHWKLHSSGEQGARCGDGPRAQAWAAIDQSLFHVELYRIVSPNFWLKAEQSCWSSLVWSVASRSSDPLWHPALPYSAEDRCDMIPRNCFCFRRTDLAVYDHFLDVQVSWGFLNNMSLFTVLWTL